MGRQQCKNAFNNRKTNMTQPESRDSTTARTEHPIADEAERRILKTTL